MCTFSKLGYCPIAPIAPLASYIFFVLFKLLVNCAFITPLLDYYTHLLLDENPYISKAISNISVTPGPGLSSELRSTTVIIRGLLRVNMKNGVNPLQHSAFTSAPRSIKNRIISGQFPFLSSMKLKENNGVS